MLTSPGLRSNVVTLNGVRPRRSWRRSRRHGAPPTVRSTPRCTGATFSPGPRCGCARAARATSPEPARPWPATGGASPPTFDLTDRTVGLYDVEVVRPGPHGRPYRRGFQVNVANLRILSIAPTVAPSTGGVNATVSGWGSFRAPPSGWCRAPRPSPERHERVRGRAHAHHQPVLRGVAAGALRRGAGQHGRRSRSRSRRHSRSFPRRPSPGSAPPPPPTPARR